MNNLYMAFEETYAERILGNIKEEPHDFSPAFEKKAERLIKMYPNGRSVARTVVKYAVIAALIAALTVTVYAVGVEIVRSFTKWTDETHYYVEQEFSDGTIRKRSGAVMTVQEE